MTDLNALETLYFAALQKPAAERPAFLDAACGGDADLRARVERLLAAEPEVGGFLGGSPAPGDGPSVEQTAMLRADACGRPSDFPANNEQAGAVIAGKYTLMEQVGEGGMGVVWRAKQSEPVRRFVAVKLIKAGINSRQVLARFEAERQALAVMDHPNIAKVLDGGLHGHCPFFVMELVKGVSITRYCDDHRLTPRQRLELFVPVCQAIQHAHQKGIIHRDIKPSNVLVALYDDRPAVKVIDFGVAKATGQPLTERTIDTGFGGVVGTPEYMSPEQATFNNLDVDTRSDVYSLGVLLYELLAGSPPFGRKELEKKGLLEMLRVVREEEPPRPSTRLSTAEGLPTLSANRGTDARRLAGLVRNELDWMVMKALEKDRTRRYETANNFAMDVQRYLAGDPVLAAPASRWYRLRKFVRRHRGPVAAAGLVLLTLLVGIAGTAWGLVQADRQRQLAEAKKQDAVDERDAKDVALKAEQQARADEAKARQQAFAALRSMTAGVVEKKFTQGTALTEDDRAFLRGVIAQYDAFAAIKADDADSRAVRAEGHGRVANMRHRLGELKEAEQDFDRAVGIYERLAADFPSRPEFRRELAVSHLNRGILLRDVGRLPEAESDYNAAQSLYKRLAADSPSEPGFRRELATTLNNRGNLRRNMGRLSEAEQDHDQALSIQTQLAADVPSQPLFREELAQSHSNRGNLLRTLGRLPEAEKSHDQAVSLNRQLAADFPSRPEYRQKLAMSHSNRGNLLRAVGRPREAQQDYDQALSIHKHLAADFPSRPEFRHLLATSHNNRGALLAITGRPREAEQDYDQALSLYRQLAADFPSRPEFRQQLAATHHNRGMLLKGTDRLKEAEQDYDQALRIHKQLAADFPSRPEFRADLAMTHLSRGMLLKGTDRPKEAEPELDQALSLYKHLAANSPSRPEFRHQLAQCHTNRGNLLDDMGRPKEAEQDYDRAVAILKQLVADFPSGPAFRQDLATTHHNRGILLQDMGRPKEAAQDYDQALGIRKQLAADSPNQPHLRDDLTRTGMKLAKLHQEQGDWAAAKRLLLEGRPHHLAALKASPQNRTYVLSYRAHLFALAQVHAGLLEQHDAVRTAETRRTLGGDAAEDAYNAACLLSLCIPVVAKHDKLDDKQRQDAVQFYGDAAMKLLREAVGKGYKDVPHMKKDTDLDPLRQREDFRKLVAELDTPAGPHGGAATRSPSGNMP